MLRLMPKCRVNARIDLREITPDDVSVELYSGPLDARGEIVSPAVIAMSVFGDPSGTIHQFRGSIRAHTSGRHGFTVRVLPRNGDLDNPRRMGLVLWK